MDQIKKLLELIESDSAFAEDILPLMKEGNESAIFATAKKKGFEITEADWQAYTQWQKSLPQSEEGTQPLNEEELDNVAGGGRNNHGDPIVSPTGTKSGCWFKSASAPEFKNGMMREKCGALSCKSVLLFPIPHMIECKWHNTNDCVDGWRKST